MKCAQVLFRGLVLISVCGFGVSAWGAQRGPTELPKQMRGITTSEKYLNAELFELLAKTDANVLRVGFSIDSDSAPPPTADNPLAPYKNNLAILDAALPMARAAGIKIILCAADVYGCKLDYRWKDPGDIAIFSDHLTAFWGAMALRYRDEPVIAAYDILNEPNYPEGGDAVWYGKMLPGAIAAIRAVNPNIWLVVEPGPWGLPGGFANMPVLSDPYVIYSFHHYAPHSYCNQKILGYTKYSAAYPGKNSMWGPDDPAGFTYWDKEALRKNMQPAIDFARKHKVRMLIGEFGVLRWAPGAEKWHADSIALFEEYGWDWCLHSLSGWNGYSVTYAPDDQSTSLLADGGDRGERWKVLTKGWSLNRPAQNR